MHKHDEFDAWLSQQMSEAESYLDDAGFTASVMARLPAQPLLQTNRKSSRWPVAIATVLSTILVLWLFPVTYVVESLLYANISMVTLIGIGAVAAIGASAAAIFADQRV